MLNKGYTMQNQPRKQFVKLANSRVNKALNELRLIGNLSNRSNYSYSQEDVDQIYQVLQDSLTKMKERFDAHGSNSDEVFKLE